MFRKAFAIAAPVFFFGVFLSNIASPARANNSPELVYSYLSPKPGSLHISPFTSLAVQQGEAVLAASLGEGLLTVTGSKSGEHKGEVRLSTDQRTVLFYPFEPFALNETVTVTIRSGLKTQTGGTVGGITYQFNTLTRLPERITPYEVMGEEPEETGANAQHNGYSPYQTHPEFDNLMPITLTVPANNTGLGFVFFTDTGIGTS